MAHILQCIRECCAFLGEQRRHLDVGDTLPFAVIGLLFHGDWTERWNFQKWRKLIRSWSGFSVMFQNKRQSFQPITCHSGTADGPIWPVPDLRKSNVSKLCYSCFYDVCLRNFVLPFLLKGETEAEEVTLGASATSFLLSNLRPNTDYVITLYPTYSRQTVAPAVVGGRTCKSQLSWNRPGRCGNCNVLFSRGFALFEQDLCWASSRVGFRDDICRKDWWPLVTAVLLGVT